MKNFTKGTVVINLTAEVAVVVGKTSEGWPILRGVNRYGRMVGGKWAADPNRCDIYPSVDEAFTAAAIRSDLAQERLRAIRIRESLEMAEAMAQAVAR